MKRKRTIAPLFLVVVIILITGMAALAHADQDATRLLTSKLFDVSFVHEIEVEIDEEDWQDLRENPLDKEKYEVSVTIDGETFEHVSMSTKGNSSLTRVASSESDRYSFKLNFSKYDKQQTYYGLDKMKLSNLYHDPCAMKDYISYRIITEAGGYAPLASYVWLKINGEDFGLYQAVEEISKGWISRTQENKGKLYKPDPAWMDSANKVPGLKISDDNVLEYFQTKKEYFGGTNEGADLVYSNDQIESYAGIFDNAETKTDEDDQARLIRCLKDLNSGENLEAVLDTEEVIGYFAGHNFTMNYDSYTGITTHNYFLYEEGGRLSAVAWDYNDGFGNIIAFMHPELTMTDFVNWGIDTPLVDAELSERPLWAWIVEDEDYLKKYHDTMGILIENYFESGWFGQESAAVHDMIKPYIETDPTFFYTPEEAENAFQYLTEFCARRAESIRKQLGGALSCDTAQQEDAKKVDGSMIAVF